MLKSFALNCKATIALLHATETQAFSEAIQVAKVRQIATTVTRNGFRGVNLNITSIYLTQGNYRNDY